MRRTTAATTPTVAAIPLVPGTGTARSRRRIARAVGCAMLAPGIGLLSACDDDEPLEETPVVQASATPAAADSAADAAPITDVLVVVVPERVPLVGRRVALADARVQTVTGARTFWVGPDPERQLFVVLDSSAVVDSAGRAMDVEPGQTVSVMGVLRALPDDLAGRAQSWSLSDANQATLHREQVYLAADSIRLSAR